MNIVEPVVYGIANCDSVKRSRAWLAEQGITATFHDFKKAGVPPERLTAWLALLGWERLLNRKGTTWRALTEARRASVSDADSARTVMLAQPSVIKRPLIEWGDGVVTVGFVPDEWLRIVASTAPSG